MKKISRIFNITVALFFAAIVSSRCFAQSPSESASKANNSVNRYMDLMTGVFDFVQRNYVDEVDPEILYKGALKGMLESLNDPYSLYLDTSTFRSLSDTTKGEFGGVGLSISKPFESTPEKPAYVEVASPVEDTPGFRAGIQAGDLIISANGTDTSTITMDEVLDILRGPVGETVDLVIRRGKNLEFPVTLTRAIIEVPTVKYDTIISGSQKTGFLRIIEFTPQTGERVQQALDFFQKEKISSLIIDLRNNPGGLITSVVEVADKFIDKGPIVSTKSRLAFENSVYSAHPQKTTFKGKMPVIVLINKGSASASEILAGALKDNHLAYLVGQRTYGKGSVQQVIPLSGTEGIKLTMARYYTPSDTNIDKIGIPPDREILFPSLSEEGEKQYANLIKEDEIEKYVEAHGEMQETQIAEYAESLKQKYPEIDEKLLRKLVRNEANRKKTSPIYDLDYDIQLAEALNIIKNENFNELVKNTRTLKELQEDSMQEKVALKGE